MRLACTLETMQGGMHNDYRHSQIFFFWENVYTLFRHLERLVIQVRFEETRRMCEFLYRLTVSP